jgi:hypothetical protein
MSESARCQCQRAPPLCATSGALIQGARFHAKRIAASRPKRRPSTGYQPGGGDTLAARSVLPARGIQHLDLAVADVERSLSFYRALLEPLGLTEYSRPLSYRGTEEIIYLQFGRSLLGLRPADGGSYRHYDVGSSIWPSRSTPAMRSTRHTSGASPAVRRSSRPRRSTTSPARRRTTTHSSHSTRTGSEWRCCVTGIGLDG